MEFSSFRPQKSISSLKMCVFFQAVVAIELPAYFITHAMMENLGRKKTLFIGMLLSGLCCILSDIIVGESLTMLSFVLGKLFITIAFSCLYIYTIEVFPTNYRHRFFGICSVVARIGNTLTPLTPLIQHSIFIFAGLAISSSMILFMLPETMNRKLPDTIKQSTAAVWTEYMCAVCTRKW